MHLPVAEDALGGHVLCNSTYSTRRVEDDLVTLVLLAVLEEICAVDEDADMAVIRVS
jgi:hypothetical protein